MHPCATCWRCCLLAVARARRPLPNNTFFVCFLFVWRSRARDAHKRKCSTCFDWSPIHMCNTCWCCCPLAVARVRRPLPNNTVVLCFVCYAAMRNMLMCLFLGGRARATPTYKQTKPNQTNQNQTKTTNTKPTPTKAVARVRRAPPKQCTNQTKPNQTKPNQTKPTKTVARVRRQTNQPTTQQFHKASQFHFHFEAICLCRCPWTNWSGGSIMIFGTTKPNELNQTEFAHGAPVCFMNVNAKRSTTL